MKKKEKLGKLKKKSNCNFEKKVTVIFNLLNIKK